MGVHIQPQTMTPIIRYTRPPLRNTMPINTKLMRTNGIKLPKLLLNYRIFYGFFSLSFCVEMFYRRGRSYKRLCYEFIGGVCISIILRGWIKFFFFFNFTVLCGLERLLFSNAVDLVPACYEVKLGFSLYYVL